MQYVIGVDYGTQSARAVVVETATGRTVGEKVCVYAHGVLNSALPDGTKLPGPDWALEVPADYQAALLDIVPGAVKAAGVSPAQIGALSIAATACTLMPVTRDLTPLCALERFQSRPHAYAKLWKHHRAQRYADRMTEAAKEMGLTLLDDFGGRISSEWAIPKVLEVFEQDREVYDAADRFMQFSDWLTALLTGNADAQNGSIATYKAMWSKRAGDPPDEYLRAVCEEAPRIVHEKLRGQKYMAGEAAGVLTKEAASALQLCPGIPVGMAHTDAHAAALGVGAADEGDYVFIMGTSSCGHLLAREKVPVPGVTGARPDGLIEGFTCYSAGQASVGDMLEWFVKKAVPADYTQMAQESQKNIFQFLEQKAAVKRPGECGMVALDWWAGNRSTLVNADLSGLIMGLRMDSQPEDIYRALLDSIAFGHREILDNFSSHALTARRVVLCGGIANKNRLLLHIMADVLNRPVEVSKEPQATALGAAMCAAAALTAAHGGYDSLQDAVRHMKGAQNEIIAPDPENAARYNVLYALYDRLYRFFGREEPELMKSLRQS